jgi:branched-chain amino acid aminotransferase
VKTEFVIANGQILKKEEFVPFAYNDQVVITRKIWYGFGGIPLFNRNIELIKTELSLLKMAVPALLNDVNEFFRLVKRVLNKSRYYRSGFVTIKLFAEFTKTDFVVECSAFEEFEFPVSQQGILLNFAEVPVFSGDPFIRFHFYNSLVWKTAEIANLQSPAQNSVFLNEKASVTHGIGANIFAVKGREIFTPSPETGCYVDLLRDLVIETARKSGLKTRETATLKKSDLLEMDEIFLTSEAGGFQWVMGIGTKRFVQKFAGVICENLNIALKEMV